MLPGTRHSASITPQLLFAKPSGNAVSAAKPSRAETRCLALDAVSTFGQSLFGGSPHEFDGKPFLDNQNLPGSKAFAPFGGGHTYCLRRYLAQREISMFLALTLHRFELEVTDSEGTAVSRPQVPPVGRSLPAAAAVAAIGTASDVFRYTSDDEEIKHEIRLSLSLYNEIKHLVVVEDMSSHNDLEHS